MTLECLWLWWYNDIRSHYTVTVSEHGRQGLPNKVLWIAYLLPLCEQYICRGSTQDQELLSGGFQTSACFPHRVHLPAELTRCQSNMFWTGRLSCVRRAALSMRSQRGSTLLRSLNEGIWADSLLRWTQKYIHLDSSSSNNSQHREPVTVRSVRYCELYFKNIKVEYFNYMCNCEIPWFPL